MVVIAFARLWWLITEVGEFYSVVLGVAAPPKSTYHHLSPSRRNIISSGFALSSGVFGGLCWTSLKLSTQPTTFLQRSKSPLGVGERRKCAECTNQDFRGPGLLACARGSAFLTSAVGGFYAAVLGARDCAPADGRRGLEKATRVQLRVAFRAQCFLSRLPPAEAEPSLKYSFT